MKITNFDKHTCNALGSEIIEALKTVGEKYGVAIKRGSGKFSDTNFTLKIEASTISQDGKVQDVPAEDFKRYSGLFNLKPDDLGKMFSDYSGKKFEIVGLKMSSRKYPIIVKDCSNGKRFKYPSESVKRLLENVTLNGVLA